MSSLLPFSWITFIPTLTDVEDDSSQLEEVRELFSGVTLPFKVDKLNKVTL